MITTLTPLKWRTVINGTYKIAETHFGTSYELAKAELSQGGFGWFAWVTAPLIAGGKREPLASGVTYAEARKAATDDYVANGGR